MPVDRQPFLHDFQQRLLDLFRASPAADLERNLKALVSQTFNKLELVTREEFDIQRDLLRELSARVEALETASLRAGNDGGDEPGTSGEAAGSAQPSGSAGQSRDAEPGESPVGAEGSQGKPGFYPGVGGA